MFSPLNDSRHCPLHTVLANPQIFINIRKNLDINLIADPTLGLRCRRLVGFSKIGHNHAFANSSKFRPIQTDPFPTHSTSTFCALSHHISLLLVTLVSICALPLRVNCVTRTPSIYSTIHPSEINYPPFCLLRPRNTNCSTKSR